MEPRPHNFLSIAFAQRALARTFARSMVLAIAVAVSSSSLADWPQPFGPNRDGWSNSAAIGDWNASAPTVLWLAELGSGYAGPIIVGDQVIAYHRVDDEEVLQSFSLADGTSRWSTPWKCTFGGGMDPDQGPRCTPVMAQGIIVCYSPSGELRGVDASGGAVVWERSLASDYDGEEGYFGISTTPIVWNNVVVAIVGGKSAAIVGVDLKTGKTRWTAGEGNAEYASPIAIEADGKSRIVCVLQTETYAIDPRDGSIAWQIPYGNRGTKVQAATPIRVGDDSLFLTASYNIGALSVSASDGKANWQSKDLISSQFASPIFAASSIYGCHGREDGGPVALRCIDPQTQTVQWTKERFGVAHLIGAGNQLLACKQSGQLEVFDADSTAFRSRFTFPLPDGLYRALPALVQTNENNSPNHYLALRNSNRRGGSLVMVRW
jgi:outer membrane protein assembly factor BamB